MIEVRRQDNNHLRKANAARLAAEARKKFTSQECRSAKLVKYVLARERHRRRRAEKRVEELERLRVSDRGENEELTRCLVLQNHDCVEAEKIAAVEAKAAKQEKEAVEKDLLLQIALV